MRTKFFALIALALVPLSAWGATPTAEPWHSNARAMLEHLVNVPTVVGRDRVPDVANWLAEQYRLAGFPADDIKVLPYEHTAALIVRWRSRQTEVEADHAHGTHGRGRGEA